MIELSNLVTVGEFQSYLESINYASIPALWDVQIQYPRLPVTHVSANDADSYAEWKGTRLPTEEEWITNQYELDGLGLYEWTSTLDNNRRRVVRGGSFDDAPEFLRSAFRDSDEPEFTYVGIGFRCVRVPKRNITAGAGGVAVGGDVHGNISIGKR